MLRPADVIAARAAARRTVELDHPLAVSFERDGETAPEPGGSFDDPGPLAVDTAAVRKRDGLLVAVLGRREPALRNHAGAARFKHGEGDPVPIGIDADHMIDEFCKHDHGTSE